MAAVLEPLMQFGVILNKCFSKIIKLFTIENVLSNCDYFKDTCDYFKDTTMMMQYILVPLKNDIRLALRILD